MFMICINDIHKLLKLTLNLLYKEMNKNLYLKDE